MTKRKRFILTSILLSVGFVGIQYLPNVNKFLGIFLLGVSTILLFFWSLRDGLGKNMTLLVFVLPFFFTLGVGLFWFLLPGTFLARIPVIIIYGFGLYALCLTANIYTVSAIRTIALLRAARGVGFVLTLFTMFLIFDAILSLRTYIYITSPLIFLSSIPLYFQGFWSIKLTNVLDKDILIMTVIASLVMFEVSLILFFWPVTVVVGSLFLTATAYMLLGLGQTRLEGRLFGQTVREYLYVGAAVFIGMFLATRWGV